MCEQLPNKGKTPSCHLKKMLQGGGGQGGRSTGGQRELDNTGSGIKRELLREADRKMRQGECCALSMC